MAKRAEKLSEKWQNSTYYSRNPSHPRAHLNLRLRRSLSWLSRAEGEYARDDCEAHDASFVFCWIAFNATYGRLSLARTKQDERQLLHGHLQRIVTSDSDAVKNAIWPRLEFPIRRLMNNKYIFQPFWDYHNQEPGNHQNWEGKFKDSKSQIERALHQRTLALWQDVSGRTSGSSCLLSELFDRLYTLRNQLLHGGATCGGSVNRHQVTTGAEIMYNLVPCFIAGMIDHPEADWKPPRYPVIVTDVQNQSRTNLK